MRLIQPVGGGYPIRFACGCHVVCHLLASGYHAGDFQEQVERDGQYCYGCAKGGWPAERRIAANEERERRGLPPILR